MGNIAYTASIQHGTPELFYSFSDIGNTDLSFGSGLNLFGWYGYEIFATSDGSIGFNEQITPWFHHGREIGINGIGIRVGVNIDNTSHDISFRIGWGSVAVVSLACMPVPGARVAAATTALVLCFYGLIAHGDGSYYF